MVRMRRQVLFVRALLLVGKTDPYSPKLQPQAPLRAEPGARNPKRPSKSEPCLRVR